MKHGSNTERKSGKRGRKKKQEATERTENGLFPTSLFPLLPLVLIFVFNPCFIRGSDFLAATVVATRANPSAPGRSRCQGRRGQETGPIHRRPGRQGNSPTARLRLRPWPRWP